VGQVGKQRLAVLRSGCDGAVVLKPQLPIQRSSAAMTEHLRMHWYNPIVTSARGRYAEAKVLAQDGETELTPGLSSFHVAVDGYDQDENNEVEFVVSAADPSSVSAPSPSFVLHGPF
jgi:hypothetical protein